MLAKSVFVLKTKVLCPAAASGGFFRPPNLHFSFQMCQISEKCKFLVQIVSFVQIAQIVLITLIVSIVRLSKLSELSQLSKLSHLAKLSKLV